MVLYSAANFVTVAEWDSNPGSLNCESDILPLSYRAPQERERGEGESYHPDITN